MPLSDEDNRAENASPTSTDTPSSDNDGVAEKTNSVANSQDGTDTPVPKMKLPAWFLERRVKCAEELLDYGPRLVIHETGSSAPKADRELGGRFLRAVVEHFAKEIGANLLCLTDSGVVEIANGFIEQLGRPACVKKCRVPADCEKCGFAFLKVPVGEETDETSSNDGSENESDESSDNDGKAENSGEKTRKCSSEGEICVPMGCPTRVVRSQHTERYTGSDIRTLCIQAALAGEDELYESDDENEEQKRVITLEHFKQALKRAPPTTSGAFMDQIRKFAPEFDPLAVANMEVGGGLLGGHSMYA
ncbi:hypothetical protein B0H63DRAFT_510992 [Podospora didyma]|uniref:Uncharacterized protein n=1 Tax=Podospora didyma TaxID=330526 RepID=A0AAE0NGI2_9PEZI|nr:hypothetical protein B0H63DRAFT_510992 [Podospora didyma]